MFIKQSAPGLFNCRFSDYVIENELARTSRKYDPPEPGNRSGYLLENGQTHSEKSPLDLPALRGNIKRMSLFATSHYTSCPAKKTA